MAPILALLLPLLVLGSLPNGPHVDLDEIASRLVVRARAAAPSPQALATTHLTRQESRQFGRYFETPGTDESGPLASPQ